MNQFEYKSTIVFKLFINLFRSEKAEVFFSFILWRFHIYTKWINRDFIIENRKIIKQSDLLYNRWSSRRIIDVYFGFGSINSKVLLLSVTIQGYHLDTSEKEKLSNTSILLIYHHLKGLNNQVILIRTFCNFSFIV